MSTQLVNQRFTELRSQAVALRREGKSRREIKEILRIGSNQTLNEALRGERPLMSTWRPNAKDDLRAKARELRGQGLAYKEIAAELGVSKSSVSLWVRDIPRPERLSYEECAKRQAAAVDAYWSNERQRREEVKVAISDAAARRQSVTSATVTSSLRVRSPTGARAPRTSPTVATIASTSSTAILG